MKFFIDTANLDQIREAYDMGVLDGVTTNPSLMAKEGNQRSGKPAQTLRGYPQHRAGRRHAEVIATDYEGMIDRRVKSSPRLNPHIVESALYRRHKSFTR